MGVVGWPDVNTRIGEGSMIVGLKYFHQSVLLKIRK